MSSCQEWIAGVGTLSHYDNIMKKDMEKGNMLKDIFVAGYVSWSINTKQRDTSLWSQLKTRDHWRLLPPSHVEVERKAVLGKHLTHSSSSGLTLPHHQEVHVNSVMLCHVMSCHMTHHYGGLCNSCFKMYCKVKVQRTCMEYEESCKVEKS